MRSSVAIGSKLYSSKYRPDIDGLRAVAVTSVVVFHAFPSWLPGGFVGVDIFFVISGYLISSIIIGDLEKRRFSLRHFYDRRVRRIFPALITVLMATLLIGGVVLFTPEFHLLASHVASSALFVENFKLWSESGYFDVASHKKPLLHLWSLAIEEQFYIFWPLLMYFTRGRHARFFAMLAVLGLASLAINIFDIHRDPAAAYYSPLGRFWELMVGALLAYLTVHRPQLLARRQNIQSLVGCASIFTAVTLTNASRDFPGFWALLPTVGAFLVLSAGGNAWINRRILSTTAFVWCGLISYPLYLWHWVLISYDHIIFGKTWWWHELILVAAAVILATLTFLFIERPFRTQSSGIAKPAGLGTAMVAVLAVAGLIMVNAISPRLSSFDAPTKDEWQFLRSRSASFNKNGDGIYPLHADRSGLALFIGDSHTVQYAERIDKVVGADPGRLGAIMAIGGGCIPIEGVSTPDIRRTGCWALRDHAYQMAAEGRFKTIVIGGAWNLYFLTSNSYAVGSGPDRHSIASPVGEAAAFARLGQTISRLIRARKRVVLVLDNPSSPYFDPTSDRLSASSTNFASNRFVTIDTAQLALRDKMADVARKAGAVVIDPFAALCTGNRCRATSETGQPVYKDYGHFNPDWAVNRADFIDAATVR